MFKTTKDGKLYEDIDSIPNIKKDNPEWHIKNQLLKDAREEKCKFEWQHANILNKLSDLKHNVYEAERCKDSTPLVLESKAEYEEVDISTKEKLDIMIEDVGFKNIYMPDVVFTEECVNYFADLRRTSLEPKLNLHWIGNSGISILNSTYTNIIGEVDNERSIVLWKRRKEFNNNGDEYKWLGHIEFKYKNYYDHSNYKYINIYDYNGKYKFGNFRQQLPRYKYFIGGKMTLNPMNNNTGLRDDLIKYMMKQVLLKK